MQQVPALGSSAAKAREQARQPAEESGPVQAVTAFLVYITPEGRYVMSTDIDIPLTIERPPTRHEVLGACTATASDTSMQMVTEMVTMNVLGNLSRMQADPNYHMMVAQARTQAEAAAAAVSAQH